MTAKLQALAASYSIDGNTLVDGIDLDVGAGELIAVVGPNGAGKSTLLRMLSGDMRPTVGAVRLNGRDISAYRPRELAARRAMLAQHTSVSFPFSVEEIIWMGTELDRRQAAPLFDKALHDVGLGDFRGRDITTLSGGEQQRAHFARILLQLWSGEVEHGPGVLLLDEPTSSLDIRHQLDLANTARSCARNGTTVVAILHDLNLATRFADRLVVLHHGRLAADGPPQEVIRAELIARVFDVQMMVRRDASGSPYILPELAAPSSVGQAC